MDPGHHHPQAHLKILWEAQSPKVKFPAPMLLDIILRIHKNTDTKASWLFFRTLGLAKYMIQISAGDLKHNLPGVFSHTQTRNGMFNQWHVLIWGLFQMTSKWAGDYERAVLFGNGTGSGSNRTGQTREERAMRSCKPDSWNKTVRLQVQVTIDYSCKTIFPLPVPH